MADVFENDFCDNPKILFISLVHNLIHAIIFLVLSRINNNMRKSFCAIFIFIFVVSYSQDKADSSKTKLKAFATVSLNSNGIASIPAFSLDAPAIIASLSLVKNRFSYDPTLAYGFDLRPWFIDNWLHYKIVNKPSFEFRTGFNISAFFSEYKLPDDESILQSQKYLAIELAATYKITRKNSLTLMYWNDRGQDKGAIKGHFINLIIDWSEIGLGKSVLMGINLQLFYINYDGNNDGLFISPKVSAGIRNIPFTLFFQGTQAIVSNIEPFPGFRWNIGVAYTL